LTGGSSRSLRRMTRADTLILLSSMDHMLASDSSKSTIGAARVRNRPEWESASVPIHQSQPFSGLQAGLIPENAAGSGGAFPPPAWRSGHVLGLCGVAQLFFPLLRNDLGEFGGVAHCRTCRVRNDSGVIVPVAHLVSARVRNAELGSEALCRVLSVQKWSKEPRRGVGGSICLWGSGRTGYIGDRQLLLEGKLRDWFMFAYTTGSVCPLYAPTGVPIPARVGRENTEPRPDLTDLRTRFRGHDLRGTAGTGRADWGRRAPAERPPAGAAENDLD